MKIDLNKAIATHHLADSTIYEKANKTTFEDVTKKVINIGKR